MADPRFGQSLSRIKDERNPYTFSFDPDLIVSERAMKATLKGKVIAESDDIVENDGYFYFPPEDVRTDWLERAPVTDKDRACPHGVQVYDGVMGGGGDPANAG